MKVVIDGTAGAGDKFPAFDDKKQFEHFEKHTCLGPGALLFRHKGGKLDTVYFNSLYWRV